MATTWPLKRRAARPRSAAPLQRVSKMDAGHLRGGRQGWAATPAPPARGVAPWNPDLMRAHRAGQARMPWGNPCGRQRADGAGVAVQCTHSCSASAIRLLVACAARGWGPAPNTPARGFAPWNPDLMRAHPCRSGAHACGQPVRPAAAQHAFTPTCRAAVQRRHPAGGRSAVRATRGPSASACGQRVRGTDGADGRDQHGEANAIIHSIRSGHALTARGCAAAITVAGRLSASQVKLCLPLGSIAA
jgi:hypothetical protein